MKTKNNPKIQDAIHEEILNQIRYDIHMWDIKELAELVGVSTSALYSLRCGRTAWPRASTLFPLAEALGYKLVLQKVRNSTGGKIIHMRRG